MDEIILRALRGHLNDVEARALTNWRRASPENERRYGQLAKIWAIQPRPPDAGAVPPRPSPDHIIRRADTRRRSIALLGRRLLARRGIAAAALVLLGLGLAEMLPDLPAENAFGVVEFATGTAETATVTLTDGSFVRLASNSRLRIPGGVSAREVWLEGRALFAVESDSARPFAVRWTVRTADTLPTRLTP